MTAQEQQIILEQKIKEIYSLLKGLNVTLAEEILENVKRTLKLKSTVS